MLVQAGYVAAFALATMACLHGAVRARRVASADVRRGLVTLAALCGVWAGVTTLRLLVAPVPVKHALYMIGLTVGLATVGAWLYFASAFSGRQLHRDRRLRTAAVLVYLVVVGVKLTNPLHGFYYRATLATTPFPHLALVRLWPHWVITGIAYAGAAAGFALLFDTFFQADRPMWRPVAVSTLAGAPVALTGLATLRPDLLLEVSYEPLGVAAFVLASLTLSRDEFLRLPRLARYRLGAALEDPVLVLDRQRRVIDHNDRAAALFPALADDKESDQTPATDPAERATTAATPSVDGPPPIEHVVPATLADALPSEPDLTVHLENDDGTDVTADRHYLVSTIPVAEHGTADAAVGWAIRFVDVSELAAQRRELDRLNDSLTNLATAISHHLRNELNVADGHLDIAARDAGDVDGHDATIQGDTGPGVTNARGQGRQSGTHSQATALEAATGAHDRMAAAIDDLITLAEQGQSVDHREWCQVGATARTAREQLAGGADADDVTRGPALSVVRDGQIHADPGRLSQLFTKLFERTQQAGARRVWLWVTDDGIELGHDGAASPVAAPGGQALEHATARSGLTLASVHTLARAHGWTVQLDTISEETATDRTGERPRTDREASDGDADGTGTDTGDPRHQSRERGRERARKRAQGQHREPDRGEAVGPTTYFRITNADTAPDTPSQPSTEFQIEAKAVNRADTAGASSPPVGMDTGTTVTVESVDGND